MTLAIGNNRSRKCAFTLIELILVLALLVVITSITLPPMAKFIRGRALDTEARRLIAFMNAAQSRAVSEGMPMLLWINADTGAYGLTAETIDSTGRQNAAQSVDPQAEELAVDSTLAISVVNLGTGARTTYHNLPAIRYLADGTIDENSPQSLKLVDSDGFSRLLTETRLRTGYDVTAPGL